MPSVETEKKPKSCNVIGKESGGRGKEQQKTLPYGLWHWTWIMFQNQVGFLRISPWDTSQIHRMEV